MPRRTRTGCAAQALLLTRCGSLIFDTRNTFESLTVSPRAAFLINDIKAARGAGRTDTAVTTAQDFQRRGQFYLDFIESENSNGFHAPQEATRILGESINFSRKGQVALRGGVQLTTVGPVATSRRAQ